MVWNKTKVTGQSAVPLHQDSRCIAVRVLNLPIVCCLELCAQGELFSMLILILSSCGDENWQTDKLGLMAPVLVNLEEIFNLSIYIISILYILSNPL